VFDFLLVLIKLFLPALRVEERCADIGRNRSVRKGVGQFEDKFHGEGGHPPTTVCVRKLVSQRCLRDPTFSRFDTIPACD